MKKIVILTVVVVFGVTTISRAQGTIDRVLAEIGKNNKTLQAGEKYLEAMKIQFKTGLAPSNPSVEYDYLNGTPENAGNQHEFAITQQFDFPTAYIRKSQLAREQSAKADLEFIATRQEILMEAKTVCLELVYRNKQQRHLNQQKEQGEKLVEGLELRMEKGDGNIMDVNKARLQLADIRKQVLENNSAANQLSDKLTELNGGTAIAFSDTLYPPVPEIPAFEQLEADYEAADPARKILEQQKLVAQKQLEVSRAQWLPKLEAGYHYQGILGQKYNGIHTGITIPLWENNNTVKLQKAMLVFDDLNLQQHRNEHYYEIRRMYEKYVGLKTIVEEYQSVFGSVNTPALLSKSLSMGHISAIEYFSELNYFTAAMNSYLEAERELHEVVAGLLRYKL